ncbi:MAG: TolB family protein, partial [Thermoanaerobaculia bacterium]
MRTSFRRFSGSALFSALSFAASAAPFTLEQVLSAPFPSELVAARAGGAVAWVFDARGARNIWAAQPPEYRGRSVTAYREDDGQEISDLAFTSDGKAIVYVRGGDANRNGDIPNPALSPDGAEQAVYAIEVSGGAPRKLAEGHSPAVSPRDGRVAFVSKGQVFSIPLAGADKPAPLFKTRGDAADLRWSPDGARLAFVSRRGDHSFVGVFDAAARTIRYLDPSVDRDQSP